MEWIGRTIGQYQIVEEVGRGGMAVVYKAWQPSLRRYVALKVLPEYFYHIPEFVARFHREAQVAARLSHPHIIPIYDIGQSDGVYFIAMEYLDGGSLTQRLAAGPLPLAEAQRILEQVAAALDYAHARGVVHRDVKPANILFRADGTAQVTDFGIARAAKGTSLTRTGMVVGTPEYMSPEQAEGRAVDYRSDLYALGVVLYQMLTGRVPFQGTTPYAVLHAAIYHPPPPPRALNPRLSSAVESVLLKALAKNAGERFQSGGALAEALRQAQEGITVQAPAPARRPVEGTVPVRQQVRFPAWLLPLAGGFLAVALVLAMLLTFPGRGTPEATPGTPPLATPQTYVAQGGMPGPLATPQAIGTEGATTVVPAMPGTPSASTPPTAPAVGTPAEAGASPSATPSPTASRTPTPTPSPTVTASPTPSSTPTPYPAPTLLAPEPGAGLGGKIRFTWQYNGPPLREGYAFDLRIWSKQYEGEISREQRRGAIRPTQKTEVEVDLADVPAIRDYGGGGYYWAVVVVRVPDCYPECSLEIVGGWSEEREFTYSAPPEPPPGPTPTTEHLF